MPPETPEENSPPAPPNGSEAQIVPIWRAYQKLFGAVAIAFLCLAEYAIGLYFFRVHPPLLVRSLIAVVLTIVIGCGVRSRLAAAEKELKAFIDTTTDAWKLGREPEFPDLFKNEYNKAADRYENIYKAVWQNFSYMALLSGGILTFGGRGVDRSLTIAIAAIPLIFWYFVTYIPMDHYGHQNRAYLDKMETALRSADGLKLGSGNFSGFLRTVPPWRVGPALHFSAALGGAIFWWAFLTGITHLTNPIQNGAVGGTLSVNGDSLVVRVPGIRHLQTRVDSLQSALVLERKRSEQLERRVYFLETQKPPAR
jgi:hypothetical protein